MSISKKLVFIVIMTVIEVSITIWGTFQLTKGARFHQLNILHLKYSAEFGQLIANAENGQFDLEEIIRVTQLVRQQPEDCLSAIGVIDAFFMKLIDTYQAVEVCENDLGYADSLLASIEKYRNNTIDYQDFVAELNIAQSSFRHSSNLFEPLITKTVDFIFSSIIPLIIIISGFNILFITYFSRSISKSIKQVTDVFEAIEGRKKSVEFPKSHDEEMGKLIVAAIDFKQVKDELADVSHLAGMTEVASSILHNVGNVLNGVNISIGRLSEKISQSRATQFHEASILVEKNLPDIAGFVTTHPQGKHLGNLVVTMGVHLLNEHNEMTQLISKASKGVDHIKAVIASQQDLVRNESVEQNCSLAKIIDDALQMKGDSLSNCPIIIKKEYDELPYVYVDKHKLLQIFVNLISNAKDSIQLSDRKRGIISISYIRGDGDFLGVKIEDNGVGISKDVMASIFSFGFTTKKAGHGFGLHSSAVAAQSLGGNLKAESDGSNLGASFTLYIPISSVIV